MPGVGSLGNGGAYSSAFPVIDLTEVESATLTFWHQFSFAEYGYISVYPENGKSTEIRRFTTGPQDWTQVALDLSPFVGQSIKLFFSAFGTTNAEDDYWYIDDVAVFSSDFDPPSPLQASLENPVSPPPSRVGSG